MLRRWVVMVGSLVLLTVPAVGFAQDSEEDKGEETTTEETTSTEEAGSEGETAAEGEEGAAEGEGEGGTEGIEGEDADEGEGADEGGSAEETTEETTDEEDEAEDEAMEKAVKGGPSPIVTLATSGGATLGGLLIGAALHQSDNKSAGGAIMLASLVVAPSIGNIMLGRYLPAAAWAGIRLVAVGVTYFGFTALEAGATGAEDGIAVVGMFSVFLGAVAAGTGVVGDLSTAYGEAASRTKSAGRTQGFALMPMQMPDGTTGIGGGFYTTF